MMFYTLVCNITGTDMAFVLAPSTDCFVWLSTVYWFDGTKKKQRAIVNGFFETYYTSISFFNLTQFLLVLSKWLPNCHTYIAIEFGHPNVSVYINVAISIFLRKLYLQIIQACLMCNYPITNVIFLPWKIDWVLWF